MINDQNYVYGDQNVQVPAHLNYGKFILNNLRKHQHKIALVDASTGDELSYKELIQFSVDLALGLRSLGVKRGDTVAVGSESRNEFIGVMYAIIFTGATYTPMDIGSGRAILHHKLELVRPSFFVCSKLFWDKYKDSIASCQFVKTVITIDDEPADAISMRSIMKKTIDIHLFEPAAVNGQSDTAIVLYSSGTTGLSKAIQLTHLNCILNSLSDDFKSESLQVAYIFGLWHHNYDTFISAKFLTLGRKLVYISATDLMNLNVEEMIKCFDEHSVNIAMLVPATLINISKINIDKPYKLDSLKILYSRSCPLHAKTMEEVKKRLSNKIEILQGYGMTESGELTSESWGTLGPRAGSVGKASPGLTMKVVDPETRKVLGANQRGEICIRGPALMKGYIGVEPESYLNDDGFFNTGDLGYYDDDRYFYVIDRLKEIIIHYGYNVAPLHLETILQLHPDVLEAGVVGKPHPVATELPTAFVVLRPGSSATEQELQDFVAVEVPEYMELKGGVIFIDKLPRNPRNKILRRSLRDMLANY